MVKEKRILSYFICWSLMFFLVMFIGINEVFGATFDNFEVTWYYRNKSNESQLLNVLKQEDIPLYASTNEYVNGYTTRVEQTFTKQIQYIVNYQLQMWFSPEQELNYRSDTLQRIIDYSYVDSDFKILNTVATENWNRSSGSGDTVLTINVNMQVLALNNTNAIRFGVYTNNNISIGFYNHTDQINYYLVSNISIEENANATIIDQNNQIINGQNNLQNSITNTQDNINQNIDDMEQSIIDSNKETQDVIKDQFNSCRESYNLFDSSILTNSTSWQYYSLTLKPNTTYTLSSNIPSNLADVIGLFAFNSTGSASGTVNKVYDGRDVEIITNSDGIIKFQWRLYENNNYSFSNYNYMLVEGNTSKPYEEYGEEICSNKIDETNDKLDGIQGALTDSSTPNLDGLENSIGWLPPGPVDSILNLPLTMLNSLTNSLTKTCVPLNLTLPYINKNIQIPCLSAIFAKITGVNGLWTWVGTIASVLILYNYLLNLYAWVDKVLTLRAEFDEAMGADLANWGRL